MISKSWPSLLLPAAIVKLKGVRPNWRWSESISPEPEEVMTVLVRLSYRVPAICNTYYQIIRTGCGQVDHHPGQMLSLCWGKPITPFSSFDSIKAPNIHQSGPSSHQPYGRSNHLFCQSDLVCYTNDKMWRRISRFVECEDWNLGVAGIGKLIHLSRQSDQTLNRQISRPERKVEISNILHYNNQTIYHEI